VTHKAANLVIEVTIAALWCAPRAAGVERIQAVRNAGCFGDYGTTMRTMIARPARWLRATRLDS
jgi:hypothetical protein